MIVFLITRGKNNNGSGGGGGGGGGNGYYPTPPGPGGQYATPQSQQQYPTPSHQQYPYQGTPSPYAQQQPQQQYPPQQYPPQGQPPVDNNMTMSIVSLFLFWPLAIPALINASKVNPALQAGDFAGAQQAAAESKK